MATDETNSPALRILCLPARTEADEITALMLVQLLETSGCLVQTVPLTSLADEMVELVEQRKPDVVCISATPPAAVMHARHLCKHVRDRFREVHLVVGLWDAQGDLTKATERIGCGAIVVATLAEAQKQVRLLIQSLLPGPEKQRPAGFGGGATLKCLEGGGSFFSESRISLLWRSHRWPAVSPDRRGATHQTRRARIARYLCVLCDFARPRRIHQTGTAMIAPTCTNWSFWHDSCICGGRKGPMP